MAIAFRTAADTYSNGDIAITVVTGDLIVAMGYGSATMATLTFSGGGTWVHQNQITSGTTYERTGWVNATTGSGSTTFAEANESGDFAWCIAAFSHVGTISFINQEISTQSTAAFSSGSGIAGSAGDLRIGGIGCYGGTNWDADVSSWDHGYVVMTEEVTHWDHTAYLIDGSAETIDLSGTRAAIPSGEDTWQIVFHEAVEGPMVSFNYPFREPKYRLPLISKTQV